MNQTVVQTLSLGSLQANKTSSVIDRYILSLEAAAADLGCQGRVECPCGDGSWRALVYFGAVEKVWVGWNVCKQRTPLKGVHWGC